MSEILLAYENGEFKVKINNTVIKTETQLEAAVEVFKATIKNNGMKQEGSFWNEVREDLKEISQVEINDEYKTVSFRDLRYFNKTGQVFYVHDGHMNTLSGGFDTFKHLAKIIDKEQEEHEADIIGLCVYVGEHHATFSLSEQKLYIAYGAFSYGSVGYDFNTGRMDLGTNSEKATFDTFRKYVISIVK